MPDTALVVMARYPEAGKTKTRLARALGNEETAQLYRAFLTDLAERFARPRYVLHWAYTPPEVDYMSFVASLAPTRAHYMTCFPQHGDEFGKRLHHAFKWTRSREFERTVLIGSDSPHISQGIIEAARATLDDADVVLGPADDGGYYLIAMRQPHDVFTGIPMSTSVVLRQTIELATSQGLAVRLLEPLFDVDELPELLRLSTLLQANATLAPATAAQLARMGSFYDLNIT